MIGSFLQIPLEYILFNKRNKKMYVNTESILSQ